MCKWLLLEERRKEMAVVRRKWWLGELKEVMVAVGFIG